MGLYYSTLARLIMTTPPEYRDTLVLLRGLADVLPEHYLDVHKADSDEEFRARVAAIDWAMLKDQMDAVQARVEEARAQEGRDLRHTRRDRRREEPVDDDDVGSETSADDSDEAEQHLRRKRRRITQAGDAEAGPSQSTEAGPSQSTEATPSQSTEATPSQPIEANADVIPGGVVPSPPPMSPLTPTSSDDSPLSPVPAYLDGDILENRD